MSACATEKRTLHRVIVRALWRVRDTGAFGRAVPCCGNYVRRKERCRDMRRELAAEVQCYVGTGKIACATERKKRRPEASGTNGYCCGAGAGGAFGSGGGAGFGAGGGLAGGCASGDGGAGAASGAGASCE